MLAVNLLGSRQLRLTDAPPPAPEPGDALLRVRASGICGSDLHGLYRPERPAAYIPGHEVVGEVIAAPPGSGLSLGQRVAVFPKEHCGRCRLCLQGMAIYCPSGRLLGFSRDGGDAEQVAAPVNCCFPIPDDITDEQAALSLDCIGLPYHILKTRLAVSPPETVVVVGLGPVGLAFTRMAAFLGARVIGVDVNPRRLDLARALGATEALHAGETDVRAAVRDATRGEGADVVCECAGADSAARLALDLPRVGGRFAFVGENSSATLSPSQHFLRKELTAVGGTCGNLYEYPALWRCIRAGLQPERIITHRFPLEEAAEAFRGFDAGETGKVVFVPRQGRIAR
jgi:threonine dehydrogenase-like Zn-dependent dehydrogenase